MKIKILIRIKLNNNIIIDEDILINQNFIYLNYQFLFKHFIFMRFLHYNFFKVISIKNFTYIIT